MIKAEMETTITYTDADDVVTIWSCQRPVVREIRKRPVFTVIAEGITEGVPWVRATIPVSEWNPFRGVKRRLTDEAREKAAERARLNAAKLNADRVAA